MQRRPASAAGGDQFTGDRVDTIGSPGVEIFSTCPQSNEADGAYLRRVADVAPWSEEVGCRGILVYSDNSLVDPWLVAQLVLHRRTGGFIAQGGGELRHCRRADALAAMERADPQGRGTLLARMRPTHELFGPVPADAFYLSKMGRRGRGAWGGSWPADPAGIPVRRHGPEIPAVLPRHVRRQHLGGPSLPRRWISGQPQRRQRRGHAWQDSKDDRADGGRTALGSQRQDAR
jgi:hypothetical protein